MLGCVVNLFLIELIMSEFNTLTVRLPNWVGDVIMTLPALHALREVGFDLCFIGKPWIHDLLAAFPAQKLTIPPTQTQLQTLLKDIPSRHSLLLTNSFASAWNSRRARHQCLGYRSDWRRWLLHHSLIKPQHKHEVEIFWTLAHEAQRLWLPNSTWPTHIPNQIQLPLSSSISKRLREQLQSITTPKRILLCPNATGQSPEQRSKIWPHWNLLGGQLTQAGYTLLTAPGPNEASLCQELIPQAHCLTNLNLQELAQLMTQVDWVIANDTGPMHLAAACAPRVIGLFGATDPHRTHPWGKNHLGRLGQWPNVDEVVGMIVGA